MYDRVAFKDPFMLIYYTCNRCKAQKMCDEAVDDFWQH